jgi:hypothetical protein
VDISEFARATLADHPAVKDVRLTGSRARGDSTSFSDWDFEVDTADFASLAGAMPSLVAPLRPICQQWDRLSTHENYMLVLEGPTKVDFLFDVPHAEEPPWTVEAETLQAIDDHFWDWILWLRSKQAAGRLDIVSDELGKMFDHLLEPMDVLGCPVDLDQAVEAYVNARRTQEHRYDVAVARTLEREVRKTLDSLGARTLDRGQLLAGDGLPHPRLGYPRREETAYPTRGWDTLGERARIDAGPVRPTGPSLGWVS